MPENLWDSYAAATGAASHSYVFAAIVRLVTRGCAMYDVLFIALGLAGFCACLGYVHLCDRL